MIYQMTQHTGTDLPNDTAHTTEGCNPKSEDLLHIVRFRPGTVTENDNQLVRHSLQKKISYVVPLSVCPSPSIRDKNIHWTVTKLKQESCTKTCSTRVSDKSQ
jgi:hypothetical protein